MLVPIRRGCENEITMSWENVNYLTLLTKVSISRRRRRREMRMKILMCVCCRFNQTPTSSCCSAARTRSKPMGRTPPPCGGAEEVSRH